MDAAGSFGISIPFCQTAWRRIPEDRYLHNTCLLTVAFSVLDALPVDDKFIAYPFESPCRKFVALGVGGVFLRLL
jgi:hypothetical protein